MNINFLTNLNFKVITFNLNFRQHNLFQYTNKLLSYDLKKLKRNNKFNIYDNLSKPKHKVSATESRVFIIIQINILVEIKIS